MKLPPETLSLLFAPGETESVDWRQIGADWIAKQLTSQQVDDVGTATTEAVREATHIFGGLNSSTHVGFEHERADRRAPGAALIYAATIDGLRTEDDLHAEMLRLDAENVLMLVRDDGGVWSGRWIISA